MKKRIRVEFGIDAELLELLRQIEQELQQLPAWEIDHIRLALQNEPEKRRAVRESTHAKEKASGMRATALAH